MKNEAVKELECQTVKVMVACLKHKGVFLILLDCVSYVYKGWYMQACCCKRTRLRER